MKAEKTETPKEEKCFWQDARIRRGMWWGLYATCAMSVLAEFFVHPHHEIEEADFFASYALLGFVACSLMIMAAKLLGFILKKPTSFYQDNLPSDSEHHNV